MTKLLYLGFFVSYPSTTHYALFPYCYAVLQGKHAKPWWHWLVTILPFNTKFKRTCISFSLRAKSKFERERQDNLRHPFTTDEAIVDEALFAPQKVDLPHLQWAQMTAVFSQHIVH